MSESFPEQRSGTPEESETQEPAFGSHAYWLKRTRDLEAERQDVATQLRMHGINPEDDLDYSFLSGRLEVVQEQLTVVTALEAAHQLEQSSQQS